MMTAVSQPDSLRSYCVDLARRARIASRPLSLLSRARKDAWLCGSAVALRRELPTILEANGRDLAASSRYGLTEAAIDRLRLSEARVEDIAAGLESVAALPDPVGEVLETVVRPNGLRVRRVRVPLGVVFFIYESRPNVTADAAAICVKSGNAVILRGGKEAAHSSQALVDILAQVASEHGLPENAIQLVNTPDRDAVGYLLGLNDYIDLAIPRGGEALIRRVAAEAKMPVMKHYTGNCHVYVDRSADMDMAERITVNSKCQRMGVCNAAESLLVHAAVAATFLPKISKALAPFRVELRGDPATCALLPEARPATEEDYATEFLGPVLSVKVVDSLDDAIAHINRYGSGHTEAIIADDASAAKCFTDQVDSSAVMVNASTRFNDGGQLGLGAEIGISTDKFHARGPCGLRELTSYKFVVEGEGQIRE